ncbi:MAG: hypothetical protein JSV63_02275 [Candidatus Aenigmatarchaeota archaeon]|nr:MAG: hypothetical protein JSV63_02275 [Candidatus Aenigmarchaeota archaeon]
MADPLSSLTGIMELSLSNPMGLITGLILSTIVGGIVILIIVEILARRFNTQIRPLNAFILAFVVSLINLFGVVALLGGFLAAVPMGSIIVLVLPVLVWIVLVKLFFRDLSLLPVLIIGVVGYFVSIYIVPILVNIVAGWLPTM